MRILGIDTSCDDTCIGVTDDLKILSNVISSQIKIHKKYGGVYPFLAKREHQRNLPLVLKKAMKGIKNIDTIAVTVGPGLEPCLWTGINFSKDLVKKWKVPIIPVNHLEAHILVNEVYQIPKNSFPMVCLVVSGGHTQLILMKKIGQYKIIGETRDDAAGECFDKTARILGLGYPGGRAIATIAKTCTKLLVSLPRPMIKQKNYDFSFSGLKTAVLYNYRSQPEKVRKSKKYIRAMAAEIQQAVIDVLIDKTLKAARDFGVKTIIVGGGVAANEELRKQLKTSCLKSHFKQIIPAKNLCTDNAAMVCACAYLHPTSGPIEAKPNLRL